MTDDRRTDSEERQDERGAEDSRSEEEGAGASAGRAGGDFAPDVEGGGTNEPEGKDSQNDAESGKVGQLEEEIAALNDRHLRLVAEFDNYRRRSQGELQESSARAQAQLIGRLLDAIDDLERIGRVDANASRAEDLLEGVGLVTRKLDGILREAGVEMLDPEGEEFSPSTMEAVMKVPADSPEDDDLVHEVFQRGCLFKGHLVRPARVSVQKHE